MLNYFITLKLLLNFNIGHALIHIFSCLYPNGSFVQVRHVLDFITIASCMIDDLSEDTSALMQHFFETELLTTGWIRALSLRDKIAPVPRPDHGTSGSYPAWPSLAVYSYGQWHNYSYALYLLHQFEPTTYEGPIGQADQVINKTIIN